MFNFVWDKVHATAWLSGLYTSSLYHFPPRSCMSTVPRDPWVLSYLRGQCWESIHAFNNPKFELSSYVKSWKVELSSALIEKIVSGKVLTWPGFLKPSLWVPPLKGSFRVGGDTWAYDDFMLVWNRTKSL